MDDDPSRNESATRLPRRTLVASIGTGVLAGFAGCSGSTDDEPSGTNESGNSPEIEQTVEGEAQFRAWVRTPESAAVGEPVSATVTIGNYGGQPGAFAGAMTTQSGAESIREPLEIDEIPSGATRETELTTTFTLADEYTLGVDGAEQAATGTLTVEPVTGQVGDSLSLGNGLTVTVTDVAHEVGLFYTTSGAGFGNSATPSLYTPGGDQIVALVRLTVENTSSQPRRFDGLTTPAGERVESYPNAELGRTEEIEGVPFAGGETLQAGQRLQRWLPIQLPRSAATAGYSVDWQRDTANTPPERRWTVTGASLPGFRLVEWGLPSDVGPGTTTSALTVRNDGAAAGTFRGVVESKGPDETDWTLEQRIGQSIQSGEEHTFEVTTDWPYTADREYRVRPLETRRNVQYVPPTLSIGGSLPTPFGRITATRRGTATTVTTRSSRENPTVTPNNGQFVWVEVEYLNEEGSDDLVDPNKTFTLTAGGTTYEKRNLDVTGGNTERFVEPFEGAELNYSHMVYNGPYGQGDSKRGIALFDVPSSVTLADARLVFDGSDVNVPLEGSWQLG